MRGGTGPGEASGIGGHVGRDLEIPLSQTAMLAETALVLRARRGWLQSALQGIWSPQGLGSWGEIHTGGVVFPLNF